MAAMGGQRQKGYMTLISAAAAVTVFGIIMAAQALNQASEGRDDAAQSAGVLAGEFKNALRALVADQGPGVPRGTFSGTDWLKEAGRCSGASGSRAYLPCEFPDHLPLGLAYRTTVSVSGGTVTARVRLGAPEISGESYPYLAGVIVTAINGASNDHVTPVTQTYHVADHDDAGNITVTVSNGPENNEYLKRDGSVTATGDFDWGGFDLSNVRRVESTHVDTQTLVADTVATEDLNAGGNITADGSIRGSTLYGTRLIDTNVYGGRQYVMNPSSNSTLRGSLRTGGSISTESTLTAARFRLSEVESEGSSCSRRYLAFNGAGEPMYCNSSNRWTSLVGGTETYRHSSKTLVNTTSSYRSYWRISSSALDVPASAYAVQIQAVCGAVNNQNIQYNIRTSEMGSWVPLIHSRAAGSGDNIRTMNTVIVPVEDGESTLEIERPTGAQSCEETGLQVRKLGYFRS